MHINEASKKLCWRTIGSDSPQICCITSCMAWKPHLVMETSVMTGNKPSEGWYELSMHTQYRCVSDPENGYCDAMPKGVE
jgi:hypothetical protein